jgi:hypothetical protein
VRLVEGGDQPQLLRLPTEQRFVSVAGANPGVYETGSSSSPTSSGQLGAITTPPSTGEIGLFRSNEVADVVGDRVRCGIQREVAAVDNADFGVWHVVTV